MQPGIVLIVPIRTKLNLTLPDGTKPVVYRDQLPLTPAYAFTDYQSQGQTLPHVIIDLATPPSGGLTPFNAYVTLSRSRSRATARLLRDFDPKLFTTAPDEYLLLADERLAHLDAETKKQFGNVFFLLKWTRRTDTFTQT